MMSENEMDLDYPSGEAVAWNENAPLKPTMNLGGHDGPGDVKAYPSRNGHHAPSETRHLSTSVRHDKSLRTQPSAYDNSAAKGAGHENVRTQTRMCIHILGRESYTCIRLRTRTSNAHTYAQQNSQYVHIYPHTRTHTHAQAHTYIRTHMAHMYA